MYTSKKVIKLYEVKVDVQHGALRFREIYDNRCVSFVHFPFSCPLFAYGHSPRMTTMCLLVRVCVWVLGLDTLKVLGALMGFL